MNERYLIPSIERSLRILEVLAKSRTGMTQAQLSRVVEIPKSSLFRILVTLQKHHMVALESDGRTFRLGSHVWTLGNAFAEQSDLIQRSQSVMESLAEECGETVFLSRLEDGEVVYLRRMESPQSVTAVRKLEYRVPAHCTATGMAMMSCMPLSEVDMILDQHGMPAFNSATTTDRAELYDRLQAFRHQKYAVIDGEYNSELLCVSSAILDRNQHPCAALTLAMLSHQGRDDERIHQLGESVHNAAMEISRSLGGSGVAGAFGNSFIPGKAIT